MMKDRKNDHIDLAMSLTNQLSTLESEFYYEPFLRPHPNERLSQTRFLNKDFRLPLWVSSMTGGGTESFKINRLLAKACHEFQMGMGVGSCRALLEKPELIKDFKLRKYLGNSAYYLNFGIAQMEKMLESNQLNKIVNLIGELEADGLIIHVNPLQEYVQPEGDLIKNSPIQTIKNCLAEFSFPIIVKEVGQGFGPQSLKALMNLPLAAIELSGLGGTNFTQIELLRARKNQSILDELSQVGHTAAEMIEFINDIILAAKNKNDLCDQFIISGGVHSILQGYKLRGKLDAKSIIGQAKPILEHTVLGEKELFEYLQQIEQILLIAQNYLVKKE